MGDTTAIERAERLIGEWPDTHISDEARRALIELVDNLQAERGRSRFLLAQRDDLAARLAVAEAAHLATYETVSRRADAAEARLAALLDAIGDPDELADLTTLHPAWAHVELLRRIAAAVQPPDPNQPTRRVQ